MIAKRSKPRRGRVIDKAFIALALSRGCVLKDHHRCEGRLTFHHVRSLGSIKDDTRGFALCAAGHLHGCGKYSIERLGKQQWEKFWGVSIEGEIEKLRAAYFVRPVDKEA